MMDRSRSEIQKKRDFFRKSRFYIFLPVFAFYLFTLSPSLSWGDGVRLQREVITGESFIIAELVDRQISPDPYPFSKLGIAAWDHPLYVVIGNTLVNIGTALFPDSNPLWWVNLVSAIFGAGAIALVFRIGNQLTGESLGPAAAALMLAVSHTYWWHAATPEVYTLHAYLLLSALWFFIKFLEIGKRPAIAAGAFHIGLALSNHFLAGLVVFPILVFTASNYRELRQKKVFELRSVLVVGFSFLLGFALILVQGLRMLGFFSVSELYGGITGTAFFDNLPSLSVLESFVRYLGMLVIQFSPLGFALGAAGLITTWRARSNTVRLIPLLYFTYMLFGVLYRVPDQFAFHLTSYVMFALAIPFGWIAFKERLSPWAGKLSAGLVFLFIILAPFFYMILAANLPRIGLSERAFGIPAIGIGVRDGLDFYIDPNKRGDDAAYRFGSRTLDALPPGSVVLAQWYTDSDEYFIFRYFQVVEGRRPDVQVAGWTETDPFDFDSQLAVDLVEREIRQHAVYLASLSEQYYAAGKLLSAYCIVPEAGLYRVLSYPPIGKTDCLSPDLAD